MNARPLLIASSLAAMLAGCTTMDARPGPGSGPGSGPGPVMRTDGCRMAVAEDAYHGRAGTYVLQAAATGDRCEGGPIEISLKTRRGAPVWRFQTSADVMFLSQDVKNRADMAEALEEWVAPPSLGLTRTIDLPSWRSGRSGPGTGREEFPFYPAEGITRARYEALRKRSLPMFCPVQGLESLVCLALDETGDKGPEVVTLGYQSFPG